MADYGINIGVNVQSGSLTKLSQQLKELRAIEKDLIDIQKSGSVSQKKLTDARRAAKDEINANKKAALDSAKAFAQSTGILQKGIGALKEQENQLRAYRRSTKNAKEGWTTFTQAIVKTNFSGAFSQLKAFNREAKATADTFKLMSMGGGGPAFARGSSMQDLLSFEPANTTNALRAYSDVLEGVIVKVDRASDTYKELAARIAEVNNQMAGTPGRMGPATDLDSPEAAAQRAEFNRRNRERRNQRLKGAAGGALLSGGFPLLMGQSMTASAIGGIGGGIGGALGGTFGFALGIIGTALGEAIEKQLKFNEALKDLNVSFAQAGSNSKILASDIDDLAKSLKITKEEALELAGAFAFLGDKNLVSGAAKLFGSKQRFDLFAGISDEASFAAVVLDIANEFGDIQATQLLNDAKGKNFDEQRILATTRLNKLKEKTVKLTKEELNTTQLRQSRRRSVAVTGLRTPVSQEEAAGITESRADLLKQLAQLKDTGKTGGSVSDPTIGLQKRLDIILGQINSEEDLLELQGKQSELSRIILRQEKAITKAKATGDAERKKLVDEEDKILSRAIEAGSIEAANLKFSRESLALADKTLKQTENLAKPLQDQLKSIKDKAAFEREYSELIRAGVVPAVAQQTVEINKQIKEIDRLKEKQLGEIDLRIESLRLLVASAKTTKDKAEQQERLNEALKRRNEIESAGEQAKGAAKDAIKTDEDRIRAAIDAIQGQINTLMDPVNQLISLADSLGNSFSESFKGIVSGSMTAQQALANLFQRTADHFLDMAAQMIAAQIRMQAVKLFMSFGSPFSGGGAPASKYGSAANLAGPGGNFGLGSGPGFADPKMFLPGGSMGRALGGPVSRNQPYLVGERGPEMFVPGAQGNIVPNNAMGGGASVTVNVDASGSSVEGDGNQAAQLGKAIGIAVQQELIKQKRPGGLLTR